MILILILGVSVYLFWENNHIKISEFEYTNPRIPTTFDGFTIAQVSDLHNKMFGKDQNTLLAELRAIDPNIILITGDLIDRRHYNLDAAMKFINGVVKIAPVYFVTGNHEAWLDDFEIAKERMLNAGVIFMDDTEVLLTKGGSNIKIVGVSDPDFLTTNYTQGNNVTNMMQQLGKWSTDDSFKILLTHRPELFDLYADNNMDLVFAGHTHGGQIRIPFVGGVVAPDQGWFPKYTSGKYLLGASTMFVSRGLGNSLIPFRINNTPEIVVVHLRHLQ